MMHYQDKTGRSGIASYEVADDGELTVVFKGGGSYQYPADATMAALLEEGQGANTYLNENLK